MRTYAHERASARVVGAVGMAICALALGVAPARAQSIVVRVGNPPNAVVPGDPVSIPIVVDMSAAGTQNIASLQFTLTWDATRLTHVASTAGPFGSVFFNENNVATGSLVVAMFNATGTTTTFTVATVDYTAGTVSGNTPLSVSLTAAGDELGNDILSLVTGAPLTLCVGTTGPLGDVNVDNLVNILDSQQIARFSVGLPAPPDPARAASHGDVTEDGVTNIIDAQQIAAFSVGLATPSAPNIGVLLPGGCP